MDGPIATQSVIGSYSERPTLSRCIGYDSTDLIFFTLLRYFFPSNEILILLEQLDVKILRLNYLTYNCM